jgi:hypothetical protein
MDEDTQTIARDESRLQANARFHARHVHPDGIENTAGVPGK